MKLFMIVLTAQSLRYFFFTASAYFLTPFLLRKNIVKKLIQDRQIPVGQISREIFYSLLSVLIISCVIWFMVSENFIQHTKIYFSVSEHSWLYLAAQIPILILVNDTYFYWMHRAVHHPKLFSWVHKVHHLSTRPTPFTSFAFHPTEAFLEAIWIIPTVMLIPIQRDLLIVYSFLSLLNSLRGHLNFELTPSALLPNSKLSWLNTGTHHSDHHKHFKGNYGLYFLFWDRWCGTLQQKSNSPL